MEDHNQYYKELLEYWVQIGSQKNIFLPYMHEFRQYDPENFNTNNSEKSSVKNTYMSGGDYELFSETSTVENGDNKSDELYDYTLPMQDIAKNFGRKKWDKRYKMRIVPQVKNDSKEFKGIIKDFKEKTDELETSETKEKKKRNFLLKERQKKRKYEAYLKKNNTFRYIPVVHPESNNNNNNTINKKSNQPGKVYAKDIYSIKPSRYVETEFGKNFYDSYWILCIDKCLDTLDFTDVLIFIFLIKIQHNIL